MWLCTHSRLVLLLVVVAARQAYTHSLVVTLFFGSTDSMAFRSVGIKYAPTFNVLLGRMLIRKSTVPVYKLCDVGPIPHTNASLRFHATKPTPMSRPIKPEEPKDSVVKEEGVKKPDG